MPFVIYFEDDLHDEYGNGWVVVDPHEPNKPLRFTSQRGATDHANAICRDYVLVSGNTNPYAAQWSLNTVFGVRV